MVGPSRNKAREQFCSSPPWAWSLAEVGDTAQRKLSVHAFSATNMHEATRQCLITVDLSSNDNKDWSGLVNEHKCI